MKKLPFIPVQPPEMTAELAGQQYKMMFNDAVYGENKTKYYRIFHNMITRLLYSNFKYTGLKPYESKMIEYYLINEGRITAIKTHFNIENNTPDNIFYGRFSSGESTNELIDFYGNPLTASITGYNGIRYEANSQDDFVIGFDTMANIYQQGVIPPIITYIDNLANILDNAFSAWQTAVETRKIGMVVTCKNQRVANIMKDTITQLANGNPFIVLTGDIDGDINITFPTNNSAAIGDFHGNFINAWSTVLDILGLENSPQNKKERLIKSEADNNRNLSCYIGADRLYAREIFVNELNEKFGTNIKVENYLATMKATESEGNNDKSELGILPK